MIRRLLGAVLLPLNLMLFLLTLPLYLVFKCIGGIFYFLYNVTSYADEGRHTGTIISVLLTPAMIFIAASSFSDINIVLLIIASVIISIVLAMFLKRALELIAYFFSFIEYICDCVLTIPRAAQKLLKFSIDNMRGYGGLSETERFKLLNSNYYKNHSAFEEKFRKKYGKKLVERNIKLGL